MLNTTVNDHIYSILIITLLLIVSFNSRCKCTRASTGNSTGEAISSPEKILSLMIRKREQNLVWVIRDRGNVSQFEIKIVFAGVTRAVVKRIIVQKSQKKILKSFAASHCPIVRFFGVFFLSNKSINCLYLVS